MKNHRRVPLIIFMLCFSSIYTTAASFNPPPADIEIKVFFSNPKLPAYDTDCGAGEFVRRKIPATRTVADAALRQLFAGPTEAEKAKGMEGIASLGKFYRGVAIRKGVAIVNFSPGAEEHLRVNGPLCMQDQVLAQIINTLKQFGTIKSVEYAINGKIIKEWDV
jgi:Sporulation and spore germination